MSNKLHKAYNQLSLTFEPRLQSSDAGCSTARVQHSAEVVAFPNCQPQGSSFRERVIQDLMRTRVIVPE
jgi:hypothetical protein